MHFLSTECLLDIISLLSFRFRLMLTPFRWDVSSAQRTHTAQFFIHVIFSWPVSVMGLYWEQWSPAHYPPWTQVEEPLLSSPSSCGLCSSHGIWGSLYCFILQKEALFGNHEGSSCSLFGEALFVMKDGLIFFLRVLELLMTLHQEWEICWAWEENEGWPLAIVFLYF